MFWKNFCRKCQPSFETKKEKAKLTFLAHFFKKAKNYYFDTFFCSKKQKKLTILTQFCSTSHNFDAPFPQISQISPQNSPHFFHKKAILAKFTTFFMKKAILAKFAFFLKTYSILTILFNSLSFTNFSFINTQFEAGYLPPQFLAPFSPINKSKTCFFGAFTIEVI
jgi:hypothetical protein